MIRFFFNKLETFHDMKLLLYDQHIFIFVFSALIESPTHCFFRQHLHRGKQLLCWEFRFWQVRTGIALIPGLLTDEISVPALVSELYSLLTLLLKTSYSSIFTQDFKSALGTTFESFNLLFHDPWEFQKENSIFQNNRELDLLDESLCVFVARMTH